MPHFNCANEIKKPEDVIPFLAKGEGDWQKGYSAYELAHSWVLAGDIPNTVRAVLNTAPAYQGAELIEGIFERKTDLGTPGRPSQTDLLALVRLREGRAVIGVEGKVDEPFGPLVREWRDGSPGKERRLAHLCETLGLNPDAVDELRYQLIHRTAAAIYETERHGWGRALMLVHSFSRKRTSLDDFLAFASAIGHAIRDVGIVSPPIMREGIELRLAWVADTVST
ncbi:MAG: hypothetical protein GY789_17100 [Hyphomicrobiales bacterium]|nr:hypothetical protein [Hyphomicrobiales bacterium]